MTIRVEDGVVVQRRSEIRMVEDVEYLNPKLCIEGFRDFVDGVVLEN